MVPPTSMVVVAIKRMDNVHSGTYTGGFIPVRSNALILDIPGSLPSLMVS